MNVEAENPDDCADEKTSEAVLEFNKEYIDWLEVFKPKDKAHIAHVVRGLTTMLCTFSWSAADDGEWRQCMNEIKESLALYKSLVDEFLEFREAELSEDGFCSDFKAEDGYENTLKYISQSAAKLNVSEAA